MHWGQLPELNQRGYEKHHEESLEDVFTQYEDSFRQILTLVSDMTEEEIFTPGFYSWTGTQPLLNWINANTASHYNWARRNIRTTLINRAFKGK